MKENKIKNFINIKNNEFNKLMDLMCKEIKERAQEWNKAKEELKGLIEPKYFDFAENYESCKSEGIVNIVEVNEKQRGYEKYQHCRIVDTNDNRLYIKMSTKLETYNKKSKYEGEYIEYWVWQTVGYLGDNYSGFLLLPMLDGRFWKISYIY